MIEKGRGEGGKERQGRGQGGNFIIERKEGEG